jgi:hypothetical protein
MVANMVISSVQQFRGKDTYHSANLPQAEQAVCDKCHINAIFGEAGVVTQPSVSSNRGTSFRCWCGLQTLLYFRLMQIKATCRHPVVI